MREERQSTTKIQQDLPEFSTLKKVISKQWNGGTWIPGKVVHDL